MIFATMSLAGRRIPVKQNTESHADHQYVAEHIQFLTAGERFVIWEHSLKNSQKYRQAHTGVDRLHAEFLSAG